MSLKERLRASPLLRASVVVHGAGAVALALSPQSALPIVATLAANHVVIGTAGMFPRCGWLGPNLTRLPDEAASRRLVALTFDDGPDPEVTPRVLALLAAAGQRATFFCIGEKALARPDLVREILAGGHGIENHSYGHPNGFALGGPRRMAEEIARAQDAFARSGAGRPSFFRAPAGIQNPFLHGVLADAQLRLVSWTRRGFDTVSRDAGRVSGRLIRNLRAGDILVLHDRFARGNRVVLDALPPVLAALKQRRLQSVPLHEAMLPGPPGCQLP